MNRDEIEVEVARIIQGCIDAGDSVSELTEVVLDYLDSIGYDNSRAYEGSN